MLYGYPTRGVVLVLSKSIIDQVSKVHHPGEITLDVAELNRIQRIKYEL